MSKPFVFEKPLGMRDRLPGLVQQKQQILNRIEEEFTRWGYEQIETPTLEFYETVGGVSTTLEQKLFKLLDRQGRSLVLRPDMTAPIARVVGSLLKDRPFPLRLSYQGNVFRAQQLEAGRNAEFPEVGVELIGEDAPDADAEIIALAVAALKRAAVPDFKLSVGHAGFIHTLLRHAVDDEALEAELKQCLFQKNFVRYEQRLRQSALEEETKRDLLALLNWQGGEEVLDSVGRLPYAEPLQRAVQELRDVWAVLQLYAVTEHVVFDLSLMREMDYYTGIHFEGYTKNLGYSLGNGGRYDRLLAQFGRPAPAIGFSLKLDRVLEVSRLETEQRARTLITYDAARRAEALALAHARRDCDEVVILHRLKDSREEINPETFGATQYIRLAGDGSGS
jgi:ATP phosphoribosyltransferase regulatory subunit